MKLLLDTHILLWWYLDDPKLPDGYVKLLEVSESRNETLALSIISLWEIAKLVSLNKLRINFSLDQWFQEIEEDPGLKVLPLNSRIILESTHLGTAFHKDPADQLIAATARCHELRLMTVDERIIESSAVAIA